MSKKSRQLLAAVSILVSVQCIGQLWNRNDSRTVDQQVPDPDSMNQNLVVNLNYSPTQIKTPLSLPKDFFSNLPLADWRDSTQSFLYQKRYFLGFSCIIGCYLYACHLIVKANKYLEDTENWAAWRADIPYQLLVTIPQQELAKDLILEVQRRYNNSQNPTDFLSPLIMFVHAIDEEILYMTRLNVSYNWLKKLYIDVIFPINENCFSKVEEKLKKLIYIKQIFLVWAAEYKVSHNKYRHIKIKPMLA